MFDLVSAILLGIIAVLALILHLNKASSDVSPFLLARQAAISETRNPGESAIYRSSTTPHNTPLISYFETNAKTVYEMIQVGLARNPQADFLGHRIDDSPFVWESFAKVKERISNFGAGLIKLTGIVPATEAMVGIYFKNSPEWTITDAACSSYSLVSVPMYDTFDTESLNYIVNHTGISVLVVSAANAEKALNGMCPVLRHLIIVDSQKISSDLEERAAAFDITISTMKEVEATGKAHPRSHVPPKSDDLFTICYTSGTTGTPKGVMLTHGNLVAGIVAFNERLPKNLQLASSDRHLSYLPASHMLERIILTAMCYYGAQVGYFRGDILKLFDDIALLKPTLFPSVPRLLSRLHDKVVQGVEASSTIKKTVYHFAYAQKKKLLAKGIVSRNTLWDRLVFGKIQARLGGHVRLMITGAAPIDPSVMEFLRIAIGCNIFEGYGQTETSATGCLTIWGDYNFPYGSHVGVPFGCCEIKLRDVPSMNYFATDEPHPRGEVCFRGNSIMKGYYKDPQKTAETLVDGWVLTGDIGLVLPNGTLKIIDRVKNIFKLSQGEYIAPEKIEMKIKSSLIMQVFVYGDSLKSCLVVLIVPDSETALPWAKEKGINAASLEELCNHPKARGLFLSHITKTASQAKLHKFETPRAVHLVHEPFSIENGLLTPTFKVKRAQVKDSFKAQIDELYLNLN